MYNTFEAGSSEVDKNVVAAAAAGKKGSGSYKLSAKEPKAKVAKKPAVKKPTTQRSLQPRKLPSPRLPNLIFSARVTTPQRVHILKKMLRV